VPSDQGWPEHDKYEYSGKAAVPSKGRLLALGLPEVAADLHG